MSRRGLRPTLECLGDIGLHHQRYVARDLPQVPAAIASTDATSAMRSRWVCHGASGSGSLSFLRKLLGDEQSVVASAASVPAAPPNCSANPSSRSRCNLRRERCSAAAYRGELEAERHRQSVLQPGAGDGRRVAMPAVRAWQSPRWHGRYLRAAVDGGAQAEHRSGIDDILAGGAPMHINARLQDRPWRRWR